MPNHRQGSIHLFRLAEIDIFLHWSWFLVAVVEVVYMRNRYSSLFWSVLEYLALFLIVLLHEFGHALACRQVGGTSDQIMLWPLGGVAYVNPPQRPGALLWSLAAGPLVNVALLPILAGAFLAAEMLGWAHIMPDAYHWVRNILVMDVGLLVFNILPIYPLDGGQILRSLLWYFLGRARSLAAATIVGFIGAAGFVLLALWLRSLWLILISGYMLMNCWGGLKGARMMMQMEKMPRREGFACPRCGSKPPSGPRWRCSDCGGAFDTFETRSVCPFCGGQHPNTMCADCQSYSPIADWAAAGAIAAVTVHPGSSPATHEPTPAP